MRKITYATTLIKNLNIKIRKYSKNKIVFPTEKTVIKSIYLAMQEATKNKQYS